MNNNVIAYHGSSKKFENFDLKFVGTGSGTSGAGFGIYFSDSKSDALCYGDVVHTCMLQLHNNVSNEKVEFTKTQMKAILDTLAKDYNADYYEIYGFENASDNDKNRVITELLKGSEYDTDIVGDLVNSLFGGVCKHVLEVLVKYGYTHTIDKETPEDKTHTHYIVYDIKSITINKSETLQDM